MSFCVSESTQAELNISPQGAIYFIHLTECHLAPCIMASYTLIKQETLGEKGFILFIFDQEWMFNKHLLY